MGRAALRAAGFAACLLWLLAALCGCDGFGEKPVSGTVNTRPVATEAPKTTPSATAESAESAEPTASPTPAPQAEPRSFPMKGGELFLPGAVPEVFAHPVHLGEDGGFFYATTDGKVFSAMWTGAGYESRPVAENLGGADSCAYVDGQRGLLFWQGSKLLPGGRAGPAVVMVDLQTTGRCNVDELTGWKDEKAVLSHDFQYYGGYVLSRLQDFADGKYSPLDRWVIADVERKSCRVLDLAGFQERNLPGWREMDPPRVVLLGENRLLVVCRVRGLAAGDGAMPGEASTDCVAVFTDFNGNMLERRSIAGAVAGEPPAIAQGAGFDVSPDGRYVLYRGSGMGGVYLLDTAALTERQLAGPEALGVFTQWVGGSFYYGVDDGSSQMISKAETGTYPAQTAEPAATSSASPGSTTGGG